MQGAINALRFEGVTRVSGPNYEAERGRFVLTRGGEPVGVLLCLPDLNPMMHAMGYRLGWRAPCHFLRHRRPDRAAIVFYSVRRSHHALGVNGVMLQGRVAAYDLFCMLLEREGYVQLAYKHAVSTIQPLSPVDLTGDWDGEEGDAA